VQGLTDRSRRPYRYATASLPGGNFILNVKREHATWGARKIRERLLRRFSGIPSRPRAPSMRCSIAMAWSSAAAACVVGPRERSIRWPASQ